MSYSAGYCYVIIFSFLIYNSACIKKDRLGLEYSRKTFPETYKNNKEATIPETWKKFDSFKFDRSIQKRKDHVKGVDKVKFGNRDVDENRGEFAIIST